MPGGLVAGMDEVGRGCLAGPVSVGVVVVGPATGRTPAGLRDSKLLTPAARERLVPPVRRWAFASAVAHASAAEIDEIGIIAALRLAGHRALGSLAADGVVPGALILDGSHDWLTPPQPDLFEALEPPVAPTAFVPPVRMRVKADLTCSVVAAASVLAKCERDGLMRVLHDDHPDFDWASNKGYAAPEHLAALRELGPTVLHRRSWRLPGTGEDALLGVDPDDAVEPADAGDRAALSLEPGMMVP
nr:ribonuclease HII [Beutenbergia cavernae]